MESQHSNYAVDLQRVDRSDLRMWLLEAAELLQPKNIHVVAGTDTEWKELSDLLVARKTLVRLDAQRRPNSFAAFSEPSDVARVESRTYICTEKEEDAGPTNNWREPREMKNLMMDLFRGSMRGRTMYVIPYCMGPVEVEDPKFGVELTDSAYVVLSMMIMTKIGQPILEAMGSDAFYVKGVHSVGFPLGEGKEDVSWPCNDTKYICHFPEPREIWSYGSGYGGNALLGKKCYALRIASAMAKDEGWLAEHMLILKLTSPQGAVHYIAAAFPSACGKTNLAMIQPTIPGWKAETVGDDIAWLRFGADGRLYAVNPETGFFGVAPGTSADSNPQAMATLDAGNTIFTNVALTDDADVWWEGLGKPPKHLLDWKLQDWTPKSKEKAAHPNSRYCTPIEQCPCVAPEWNDPHGVPLSAILFGGRRKTTVPLVTQSFNWAHGVFIGSVIGSEQTAAAEGKVGAVRRDPMAMIPFIGYHVGDYLQHWLDVVDGRSEDLLPKIFYVNWFRRDAKGKFLWPGFGENSRVLDWIIRRVEGNVSGASTPIGVVPTKEELNLEGLDITDFQIAESLKVDRSEWKDEIADIKNWYDVIGERLPEELQNQLHLLQERISHE